jgi:glucokinase
MTGGVVVLGVDVGGTTTAAGAVSPDGDVLVTERVPTHEAGRGTAVATITALIESVRARAEAEGRAVAGVGVGVPAIVDPERGAIGEEVHHVPELAGLALARMLETRAGLPVVVDNDVNALALGEARFGAGRGARSVVVLAPGTGFGTGLVLDGRLVRGAGGFGGEFGHAPVNFDGRPCWCGGRGCVAVYASGRGLAEAARARVAAHADAPLLAAAGGDPQAITAAAVFAAAAGGDPIAAAVVEEACQALGALLGVVVNGLNPEVVVVTGGVAAGFQRFEKTVLQAAARYAYGRALAMTRIRIVPGDKSVSVRGAAALVLDELAGSDKTGRRTP